MKKELVFYRCNICGNIICMVRDAGVVPTCCGEEMERLTVNTEDAAHEKHVPVVELKGRHIKVRVGSLPHPMTGEHSIEWIAVLTRRNIYVKTLYPGDLPEAEWRTDTEEQPVAVYAYCSLHGLWSREA